MNKHLATLLVLMGGLLLPTAIQALEIASIFGDHMVLQRDKSTALWGHATPGSLVDGQIAGQFLTCQADADGKFAMNMAPVSAGGPYNLVIAERGTNQQITVSDILFGDVWVSAGQSNMEYHLKDAQNGDQEISQAQYPNIRFFNVEKTASLTPVETVRGANGISGWHAAESKDPDALGGFSAVAYFFGKKIHLETGVPIGLINSAWGGTNIEPWTPAFAFENPPVLKDPKNASPENATNLYNGMIYPISKMTIKGFLWYQGENNISDGLLYEGKMERLIGSWRQVFGGGDTTLGFYWVQIAPFGYEWLAPDVLPYLWEAQSNVLKLPKTGMAVINDVGNIGDIHPKDKATVGFRLALWALHHDYGRIEVDYSGPVLAFTQIDNNQIILTFDHAGSGLAARDGKPLTWFSVAGDDETYYPATTVTIHGNKLIITCDEVKNPKAVRFAWANKAEPNLVGSSGLPASSFRTRH